MAEWEKYFYGLTKAQLFFIISLSIYLVVISKITTPVPNFNDETDTLLYTKDSSVPPTYFSNNHLVFALLLLFGLVTSSLVKEVKGPEMADIDEAKEIIEKFIKKRKTIRTDIGLIEIGEYYIDNNFLLPISKEKEEEKPRKYVLQINITDTDGIPHYVKGYVHPFKRYIGGFIEMDKPLGEEEQCPDCGKEFDVKYIDTEDYKTFKKIKEDLKD